MFDIILRKAKKAKKQLFDFISVSNMRREDYKMIFDDSKEFVDIIQCNNAPSTRTPRGHQFPAAFMHHVSKIKIK